MPNALKLDPFSFDDFSESQQSESVPQENLAETPASYTQEDLDNTYQRGLADGEHKALSTMQEQNLAIQNKILAQIVEEIKTSYQPIKAQNEHYREQLSLQTTSFLKKLTSRLGTQQIEKTAISLLNSLFTSDGNKSEEKGIINIHLHPEEYHHCADTLTTYCGDIAEKKLCMPVADPALRNGECRITWQDGAISYDPSKIDALIEKITHINDHSLCEEDTQ